jgi:hypothetical protein
MNARFQAPTNRLIQSTRITMHTSFKGKNRSMWRTLGVTALAVTVLLAACSPAGSPAAPTPTSIIGSLPNPVNVPTVANNPNQKVAAPASLDPCQVITSQEASTLAGATFGAGVESTTQDGGGKICTYGANTTNVFMVEVAQAADLATAQAEKAQFISDIKSNMAQLAAGGLTVTELPNLGDGATMGIAVINIAGETINGGAIGVLKGTIFFGFSDLVRGGPAPTAAALQSEAQSILGTLP